MSKPNNQADVKNANKGNEGTNTTYDKAQGNRGEQKNPNNSESKGNSGSKTK